MKATYILGICLLSLAFQLCGDAKKAKSEAFKTRMDSLQQAADNEIAKLDLIEAYVKRHDLTVAQATFLYDTLWKYPSIQPKGNSKEYKSLIKFIKSNK